LFKKLTYLYSWYEEEHLGRSNEQALEKER